MKSSKHWMVTDRSGLVSTSYRSGLLAGTSSLLLSTVYRALERKSGRDVQVSTVLITIWLFHPELFVRGCDALPNRCPASLSVKVVGTCHIDLTKNCHAAWLTTSSQPGHFLYSQKHRVLGEGAISGTTLKCCAVLALWSHCCSV